MEEDVAKQMAALLKQMQVGVRAFVLLRALKQGPGFAGNGDGAAAAAERVRQHAAETAARVCLQGWAAAGGTSVVA